MAQVNIFEILLNQTQIKRKMVYTILFRLDLIKFRKRFLRVYIYSENTTHHNGKTIAAIYPSAILRLEHSI